MKIKNTLKYRMLYWQRVLKCRKLWQLYFFEMLIFEYMETRSFSKKQKAKKQKQQKKNVVDDNKCTSVFFVACVMVYANIWLY